MSREYDAIGIHEENIKRWAENEIYLTMKRSL